MCRLNQQLYEALKIISTYLRDVYLTNKTPVVNIILNIVSLLEVLFIFLK